METTTQQDESMILCSAEERFDAFAFRTYTLIPRLMHWQMDRKLDRKALFDALERSRRIEMAIDCVYSVVTSCDNGIGFGVCPKMSSRVSAFLRDKVWHGEHPSWVSDCMTLGSFIPIVDNVELVTCTAENGMSFRCLRQAAANAYYNREEN